MRQRCLPLGLIALLSIAVPSALIAQQQDADISGKWEITIMGEAYNFDMLAEIEQEGEDLSGIMDGPNGKREFTGKIENNEFSFSYIIESPEGDFSVNFSGTFEEQPAADGQPAMQRLSGMMEAGEGQFTAQWIGRRWETS